VQAHRVKLFAATQRGEWDDRGTGFLVPTPDGFRINSEAQLCSLLLNHTIRSLEYKQQNDNILFWTENTGITLAISFQSSAQTRELLEHICNVQGRDVASMRNEEDFDLPSPSLEQLPDFARVLTTAVQKAQVARAICTGDFLSNLEELFKTAEETRSPALPHFFTVFKAMGKFHLVLLCDSNLLDILLSDPHYLTFFGALERKDYSDDPDLISAQLQLRSFLSNELTFNNVLCITDVGLLSKVHKAYRVLFLRDTALARCLDDCTANFLTNFIVFSYTDIISHYVTSTQLRVKMVELLAVLSFPGFSCLCELCRMAKNIAFNTRILFYQSLSEDGCFDLLEKAIDCPSFSEEERKRIESFVPEMIQSIMQITPQFIKRYIISEKQQRQGFPFLSKVCRCILSTQEVSALQGMSDLLKALLEPDDSDPVYVEICEVFYDNIIEKMTEKLEVNKVEAEELRVCLIEVLQILSQCAQLHKSRIASFLGKSEVLVKAVRLFDMQDKCLTLAVLRFLRAVIARNDPVLCQRIVELDLLRPALRIFIENGMKENMLFSSLLALLDVIKRTRPKAIIEYLVGSSQLQRLEDDLKDTSVASLFASLAALEPPKEPASCFSIGEDICSVPCKRTGDDLEEGPAKHSKSL